MLAVVAAVAALEVGLLPPDVLAVPLGVAASVHIPLSLIAWGAAWEPAPVARRHIPSIRTALAIRMLSGLALAAAVLTVSPPTLPYAMRSAATVICLLAPVGPTFVEHAASLRLNQELARGLAQVSLCASCALFALFAFAAWVQNIVPFFMLMEDFVVSTAPMCAVVAVAASAVVLAAAVLPWALQPSTQPRRDLVKMQYVGGDDNTVAVAAQPDGAAGAEAGSAPTRGDAADSASSTEVEPEQADAEASEAQQRDHEASKDSAGGGGAAQAAREARGCACASMSELAHGALFAMAVCIAVAESVAWTWLGRSAHACGPVCFEVYWLACAVYSASATTRGGGGSGARTRPCRARAQVRLNE